MLKLDSITLTDVQNVVFRFATKEEGREILGAEDEFVMALSSFDRSSRLKQCSEVSREKYLDFIQNCVLDWTESEKEMIASYYAEIKTLLAGYNFPLPETIYIVKTSGEEEGYAAYCRNKNVIVFSKNYMTMHKNRVFRVCLHELFHIFSKNNLEIREKLYNKIGFYSTQELQIPEDLYKMKVTNPDGVHNSYYFNGKIDGAEIPVVPLLIAYKPYDEAEGGEFFDYLDLLFYAVDVQADGCRLIPEGDSYKNFPLDSIENYFEIIGNNTDYVIHPEEILAENFVLAVLNDTISIDTAHPIEAIRELLKR